MSLSFTHMVITHDVEVETARSDVVAPAVGAAVWAATLAASTTTTIDLTIFQVFLLLGMLVVVPLGLPLATGHRGGVAPWMALGSATLVLAAAVTPFGPWSTALTAPWLVCTAAIAVGRLAPRAGGRRPAWPESLADAAEVAACGWLVVGAVALTLSRAQLTYLGVPPELVELGAVHFSYAGFAAGTIAGQLLRRHPSTTSSVAAVATVGGAVVVAVGHLTVRPLELVGASSMTIGLATIGIATWSLAPPRSVARVLLRIAALSVILPMALALQYAWSLTTGGAHPPLAVIASIHGTLNAFGFSIGGLVAWRLLARPLCADHDDRAEPATGQPNRSTMTSMTTSGSNRSA